MSLTGTTNMTSLGTIISISWIRSICVYSGVHHVLTLWVTWQVSY